MSDDFTDEELAEEEILHEDRGGVCVACGNVGGEWPCRTFRLIAALRASREALADTQRDLVDARHDRDQARMDAAKRLVDYRVSRDEAERLRQDRAVALDLLAYLWQHSTYTDPAHPQWSNAETSLLREALRIANEPAQ